MSGWRVWFGGGRWLTRQDSNGAVTAFPTRSRQVHQLRPSSRPHGSVPTGGSSQAWHVVRYPRPAAHTTWCSCRWLIESGASVGDLQVRVHENDGCTVSQVCEGPQLGGGSLRRSLGSRRAVSMVHVAVLPRLREVRPVAALTPRTRFGVAGTHCFVADTVCWSSSMACDLRACVEICACPRRLRCCPASEHSSDFRKRTCFCRLECCTAHQVHRPRRPAYGVRETRGSVPRRPLEVSHQVSATESGNRAAAGGGQESVRQGSPYLPTPPRRRQRAAVARCAT